MQRGAAPAPPVDELLRARLQGAEEMAREIEDAARARRADELQALNEREAEPRRRPRSERIGTRALRGPRTVAPAAPATVVWQRAGVLEQVRRRLQLAEEELRAAGLTVEAPDGPATFITAGLPWFVKLETYKLVDLLKQAGEQRRARTLELDAYEEAELRTRRSLEAGRELPAELQPGRLAGLVEVADQIEAPAFEALPARRMLPARSSTPAPTCANPVHSVDCCLEAPTR